MLILLQSLKNGAENEKKSNIPSCYFADGDTYVV